MKPLLNIELHCHTRYSKDSLVEPEDLIAAARQKGLDRVVVTDHNTIAGAVIARVMAPELIIVGEEVLTTRGELLAFFVEEEIPRLLAPEEAIRRLKAQGAFISVSHPFDRRRHGWALADLENITPLVDAIEVFNSRCQVGVQNRLARDYAEKHGLVGTVGSDAHTVGELGRSRMVLPSFETAEELRQVLPQAQVMTQLSSPFIHLTSTYARLVKATRGRHENSPD